jgi:hypothetical protein
MRVLRGGVVGIVLAGAVCATGADSAAATAGSCPLPQFGPGRDYHPQIDPARFSAHITSTGG